MAESSAWYIGTVHGVLRHKMYRADITILPVNFALWVTRGGSSVSYSYSTVPHKKQGDEIQKKSLAPDGMLRVSASIGRSKTQSNILS